MSGLFTGAAYDPGEDDERLTGQLLRVYEAMKDGQWRTLSEIHDTTGDPPASISAQLRHLRKARFGSYRVERRNRGLRSEGLYEYRVLEPEEGAAKTCVKRTAFLAGLMYAAKIAASESDLAVVRSRLKSELIKAAKR